MTARNHECKECGARQCWDWTYELDDETGKYDRKVWECQNCWYTEEYKEFKFRKDTITPSQESKIEKIERFFQTCYTREPIELATFTHELNEETGSVYVSVETTDNIYTMNGGFFSISRMGKVTCLSVYGLTTHKDSTKKFYEQRLKKG